MGMRRTVLTALMILMGGLAFAGTTQISPVSNGNQTSVVNDNFDSLQGGVNALQGLYSTIQSTFGSYFTNGILNQASGGTGVNSSSFTVDGSIYQGSSGFASTSAGIAGQFLQSNGAGTPPSFASIPSQYLNLISTTNFSGSTTSPDISITAGKNYMVIVRLAPFNTSAVYLDFNSSTSGAITLVTSGLLGNIFTGTIYLQEYDTTNHTYTIRSFGMNASSGTVLDSAGKYTTATPTSFRFRMSVNNVEGTVYLYEIVH